MSRINLKKATVIAAAVEQHAIAQIETRLPRHVEHVAPVDCDYRVVQKDDYYILDMETAAVVDVCCQRCLEPFQYSYHHQQTIACCLNEATAHRLMKLYDCIVVPDGIVDLIEVITDDIHLNVPEMHADVSLTCSSSLSCAENVKLNN